MGFQRVPEYLFSLEIKKFLLKGCPDVATLCETNSDHHRRLSQAMPGGPHSSSCEILPMKTKTKKKKNTPTSKELGGEINFWKLLALHADLHTYTYIATSFNCGNHDSAIRLLCQRVFIRFPFFAEYWLTQFEWAFKGFGDSSVDKNYHHPRRFWVDV